MAQEAVKGPQGIFKPSAGVSKQQQQAAEESDEDVAGSGDESEVQNGSSDSESGQ